MRGGEHDGTRDSGRQAAREMLLSRQPHRVHPFVGKPVSSTIQK